MKGNPITHIFGWSRLLKAIAGKHNISVQFDRSGDDNSLRIDGNHITVPMPTKDWQQRDYDNVLYAVDSYGSMWRYGEAAFKDFAELPADQPIGWIMRELEQVRTSYEAGEEFRGSKDIMSVGVGNRMQDVVVPAIDHMDPKVKALLQQVAEGSNHWNTGFASALPDLMHASARDPEAAKGVDKLDGIDFQEKLNDLQNPAETLKLAKEVFEALWDEDPDEQEEKERAMSGQPEDGEGEGDPSEGEGGGDGEGAGMQGTNPHSCGDMLDGDMEEAAAAVAESDGNSEPPDPNGRPQNVLTTPPSGRHHDFEDPSLLEHIDLRANPDYSYNGGNITPHLDRYDTGKSAVFANRMRRHLMVKSQSFYTHGHRKGKIGTRHLYKLCVDYPMPGEDRMFKRKHESDTLDTCLSILVDYSGSMSGQKTILTHIGTDLLVHAMQVLGVPCEVSMFSTIHQGTTLYTVKNFEEHVSPDTLLDRSERASNNQSNNNDSAAVMFKYERLRRRTEKRKILLVLSDGHPSTHNVSNPQEGLKIVTNSIEADPNVELLGLGILSEAVDRYYPHHRVVHEAEELQTALIDLVADKMLLDTHLT